MAGIDKDRGEALNWLTDLEQRVVRRPAKAAARTAAPRKPKAEVHRVLIQIRPANREAGDPGEIEPAYYTFADGVLTLTSETGRAIGEPHTIAAGEKPERIAGSLAVQLRRKKTGTGDFNRRLSYGPPSVA